MGRYCRLEGVDAAKILQELRQKRIGHEGVNEPDPMKVSSETNPKMPSQRGLVEAFDLSWKWSEIQLQYNRGFKIILFLFEG